MVFVLVAAAIWGAGPGVAVAASPSAGAAPKASILVDADSGKVLAEGNPHVALPAASTEKLMTALVALENLPAGGVVKVGSRPAEQGPLRIGMQAGQAWSLEDTLHALLMVSANDAAYALAEAASGSVEAFAAAMNAAAARYGMRDSTFADPAGLDDPSASQDGGKASAYDLAIAARNALAVPDIVRIAGLGEYRFTGPDGHEHRLHNINKLLGRYPGAVGLKTGYTRRAGHTLIAAARRDGRTMIAVVLGADDAYGVAARLLDQGFATPLHAAATEQLPGVAFHPASTGPHRQKDGRPADPPVASSHGRPAHRGVPWTIPLAIVVVTVAVLVVLRPRAQRSQWRTARRSVSQSDRLARPDERVVPVPTVYDYAHDDGIAAVPEKELV
jgi:D-alanyl-D-alanine carboxypeptidase